MEGGVLFGVEDFEQSGGRVAIEGLALHLVDFVEDKDGIAGARFLDALNDTPRHGADIGAAMATYLGLVVHAAEGHADILAAEGGGDALAQRGLAGARRADEAEDRRLHVALEGEDGDMLEDAVLDLFDAVMVLVEHLAGMVELEVIVAKDIPGEREEQVEVVDLDGIVGGLVGHALQFLDLFSEKVGYIGRPLFGGGTVQKFGDILVGRRAAEFVLYDVHLLIEEILALLPIHLHASLLLDLLGNVEVLDSLIEELGEEGGARHVARRLKQLLFLIGRDVEMSGDEIDKDFVATDIFEVAGERRVRVLDFGEGLKLLADRGDQRLKLFGGERGGHVGEMRDRAHQVRILLDKVVELELRETLNDSHSRTGRDVKDLEAAGHDASSVDIGELRFFDIGGLSHDTDEKRLAVGLFEEAERPFAADSDGEDDAREQDILAEREDGEDVGLFGTMEKKLLFFFGNDRDKLGMSGKAVEQIFVEHNINKTLSKKKREREKKKAFPHGKGLQTLKQITGNSRRGMP